MVNRVHDDTTIAVEYYTLINYLKKNYSDRLETIQMPYLHLISHCIELFYKIILEFAIKCRYVSLGLPAVIHNHDLTELCKHILSVFENIAQENCCSDNDKFLFEVEFPKIHSNFVELVRTDTTTYRYAKKRNKKGEVIEDDKFKDDSDSPNMIDVLDAFDKCYDSLAYTHYILYYIFPEMPE